MDHLRPPRDWLSPSLFVAAYPCTGARAAPDRRRLSEAQFAGTEAFARQLARSSANWSGGTLGFPGAGTALGISGTRGGRAFQLRKR